MSELYTITAGRMSDYNALLRRIRDDTDDAYYREQRTWYAGMPANEMAESIGRQMEIIRAKVKALRATARKFGAVNSEGELDDGVEARATEKLLGSLETQKAKFEQIWRQHINSQSVEQN